MSKEDFLKATQSNTQKYTLNGYETTIRGLTLKERSLLRDIKDPATLEATVVAIGCEDLDSSDIEAVMNLPSHITADLLSKIMILSGMVDDEKKA